MVPATVSAPQLTRRAFIAAGATVGASALGLAIKPGLAKADVLRPPGALPEPTFQALCIRCYRCISVCPTQVLRPASFGEGTLGLRTPCVSFAKDACIFCGKCQQVCPTQAIGASDPYRPSEGRIGVAVVYRDRCLAYVDGSCRRCIEECPYQALAGDSTGRPVVDVARCNGCGVCEKICPALVYRSFQGGNRRGIGVLTQQAMQAYTAGEQQ